MRKITLLLAVVLSMTMFAERYLVQLGTGSATTWRTAGTGETLVDLTVEGKTLNEWYNATVVSNDEVWVASGTYVLSAVLSVTRSEHSVYGGFAGTETMTSERVKSVDGSAWDFTNETILDGNNAVQILLAGNSFPNTIFDGLTITKAKSNNAATQFRDGITIQNCKIINNNSTGNGGGVNFYNGGAIINSYIAGNTGNHGGAVYSNNASTVTSIVSGCLIENNIGNSTGGGLRVQGTGTGLIEVSNCIIRGNGLANMPGGAIYTNSATNKFTNCLVYNNQGTNVIYFNGGVLNQVNIVNNVGQVYIANATVAIKITNSVVWGNKTNATGETNTGITSNTTNSNVIIHNTAISPALAEDAYTQAGNITLEYGNNSQELSKGPGFVLPTTFWGVATTPTETTELMAADWTIKHSSGLLNLGETIAEINTDFDGTTRPQGSAYDMGAYELSYYNTSVSFNTGGTVNALTSGDIVSEPKGKMIEFTITPNSGMKITSVKYNDVEVKDELVENVYTAPALAAPATLVITFDVSTALDAQTNNFSCFSNAKSIEVRGLPANQMVEIYSINGMRMATQKAENSSLSFTAKQGIYLVRVAGKINKVVIY
jgi:hypothetical protein